MCALSNCLVGLRALREIDLLILVYLLAAPSDCIGSSEGHHSVLNSHTCATIGEKLVRFAAFSWQMILVGVVVLEGSSHHVPLSAKSHPTMLAVWVFFVFHLRHLHQHIQINNCFPTIM